MTGKIRIVLFIISLTIIILGIIFVWIFSFTKSQTPPQNLVSPTPYPTDPVTKEVVQPSRILSIFPNEDTNKVYFPIQQIKLTLDRQIDPLDADVTVSPSVNFKVGLDPSNQNVLIISPAPAWELGITTITISQKGKSGKFLLDRNVVYKINTNIPEIPDEEDPEYHERF